MKDVFSGGGKGVAKEKSGMKLPRVFHWVDFCLENVHEYLSEKQLDRDAWAREALTLIVEHTNKGRNQLEMSEAIYLKERVRKVFAEQ